MSIVLEKEISTVKNQQVYYLLVAEMYACAGVLFELFAPIQADCASRHLSISGQERDTSKLVAVMDIETSTDEQRDYTQRLSDVFRSCGFEVTLQSGQLDSSRCFIPLTSNLFPAHRLTLVFPRERCKAAFECVVCKFCS